MEMSHSNDQKRKESPYMVMLRNNDRQKKESPYMVMLRNNDQKIRIYVTKSSSKIIL